MNRREFIGGAAAIGCLLLLPASCGLAWAGDVDVRDFGAVGDGTVKNTAAIQRAIDTCAKAGGGEVRFENGRYLTGMVFLRDNVTIRLGPTATLLGSPDDADYPTNAPCRHLVAGGTARGRTTALIVADECRNVGIVGTGTIDCNGMAFVERSRSREYGYTAAGDIGRPLGDDEWVNWKYRRIRGKLSPPRMVLFAGCRDVRVLDVTMTNSAAGWGYWVTDCDRVVFDRVKILANPELPNNDGIHINASRDVSVSNCRIVAGDDALVVRCNNRPFRDGVRRVCARVTVSNCQLTSHANCIRVGWLNDGTIRDCAFSNLTMTDSACGIGIDLPKLEKGMSDYGVEASRYENLVFSTIVMDGIYSSPVRIEVADDAFTRMDAIRALTFSNLRCAAYKFPNLRTPEGRRLEDIVFSGCSFTKVPDGTFPGDWRQKGAAYWWNNCTETYANEPGVSYVNCVWNEKRRNDR